MSDSQRVTRYAFVNKMNINDCGLVEADDLQEAEAYLGDRYKVTPVSLTSEEVMEARFNAGFRKSIVVGAFEGVGEPKEPQHKKSEDTNLLSGMSKVDLYKWVAIGKPGKLEYLDKNLLTVDHAYQRSVSNARATKLARRWNWLACGVLIVAIRHGKHFIVDGQHRWAAAMKRQDITSLPCLVFESTETKEEAVAFRDSNKERKGMNSNELWAAEIIGEDEATMYADRLIAEAGRVPSHKTGPGSVRCLSVVVGYIRSNREVFDKVWPIAVRLCEGFVFHERVLSSLMHIESNLIGGGSITSPRWTSRLYALGYEGVLAAANRAAAYYSRGGARVWASGVVLSLNKGCRVNKLELRGDIQDASEGQK